MKKRAGEKWQSTGKEKQRNEIQRAGAGVKGHRLELRVTEKYEMPPEAEVCGAVLVVYVSRVTFSSVRGYRLP